MGWACIEPDMSEPGMSEPGMSEPGMREHGMSERQMPFIVRFTARFFELLFKTNITLSVFGSQG